MKSAFLETVGFTFRNKVLEYFLMCRELDIAIADVIEEYNLNKATTYTVINELLAKEIIKPTRKIGNTQLYNLNKNNIISQQLIRLFDDCIAKVVEEYREKEKQVITIKNKIKEKKK
ncbi:hypothetical protein J4434_02480 [Candidatus Woesearchaeota archaeon]|nr:hypothetical protein [Candidatus Woesearchaeota archaeon]